MKILNLLGVVCLTIALTACGGGGSDSSGSTNTSTGNSGGGGTSTSEPKVVNFKLNKDSCTVKQKCENIISIEIDRDVIGAKFALNGKQGEIVFSDSFITIPDSGEITFDAIKTFHLNLTSQVAGDVTIQLVSITDTNGTYNVNNQSVSISFNEKPVEVMTGQSIIYFTDLNGAKVTMDGQTDETNIVASKILVTRYKNNQDGEYVQHSEFEVSLDKESKFAEELDVGSYYDYISVHTSFGILETNRIFNISHRGLSTNTMSLYPANTSASEISSQKDNNELGEFNLFNYFRSDTTYNWVIFKPEIAEYSATININIKSFSIKDNPSSSIEIISNLPHKVKVLESNFEIDMTPDSQIHDFLPVKSGTNSFVFELSNFNSGNKTLEFETRINASETVSSESDTAVRIKLE